MKVALVYDRINKWGGAERVLLALHEIWPEAPLYTGVYNARTAGWADVFKVNSSLVQKIPLARRRHELFPYLMPLAFESFDFNEYDIVISVTSAEAKGVITKPETLHICYCLTPTRYLWSHSKIYRQSQDKFLKVVSAPAKSYLRAWDQIASSRPDHYIAISNHVSHRIKKYYGRESEVIYPPVEMDKFAIDSQSDKADKTNNVKVCHTCDNDIHINSPQINIIDNPYFLVVSRLVSYKRIDIAIKACNSLKMRLVIVGEGVEGKRLRRLAGKTVKLVSNLTERELLSYYQSCRALIVPQEEDFGLSAVEAQAAKSPVIAYGRGGAAETIIKGKTGEFFEEQTVEALTEALQRFDPKRYSKKDLIRNAQKFNKERFKKEFKNKIEKLWEKHLMNRIGS